MFSKLTIGDDGFYHPKNEEEVVELVQTANAQKVQVRCRGAAHSLSRAIYTDPGMGYPEIENHVSVQEPPMGSNINIIFDQYNQLEWIDENKGIIEVEAGIHLGIDPEDPTGASTLENSLLHQIFLKGWGLSDLGGITHQTVSGFLMTGSAGGTLMYSLEENLLAIRMIDGEGTAAWIEKDQDEDLFNAIALSLGLLGIVSKVRFTLTKNYFLFGQQMTTPTAFEKCAIDLFGDGVEGKPSITEFLKRTPYARLLWWPQKGVERVVIWQASRGEALPVFYPKPYNQFSNSSFITALEELGGNIIFTMLGNTGFSTTWKKLKKPFKVFRSGIEAPGKNTLLPKILTSIAIFIVKIQTYTLVLIFSMSRKLLLSIFPKVLSLLQPNTKKGKANVFMDYTWRSLPMDNGANDILLGTEFTEIWVPISETKRCMNILKKMFEEKGLAATGYYSTELYAGIKSNFWLSPSYKEDAFRIDIFWFTSNEGSPAKKAGYYSQFWEALRNEKVPFRLHWAKFMPEYSYLQWAEYYRSQYPKWDEFMKLRKKRDPNNIFLNDYWSRHLFGKTRREATLQNKPIDLQV